MKAVLLKSPGQVVLTEIERPVRQNDHLLIQVKSVGICGSDIGAYRGTNPLVSYPRVIGHEICGEVIEKSHNSQFAIGDRVMLEPYVYCGQCYPCSIGHTNCCEHLSVLGVHQEGGMKEIISHPESLTHHAPASIDWDILPMAEPLVIAMHALTQTAVKTGEYVVILGGGQIGLLAAAYALTLGAKPIVIDQLQTRLDFALSLGVEHVIDFSKENPLSSIKKITGNRMAEVVIEASGSARAIQDSLIYASFAGRIALVGWPHSDIPLTTALITKKGLSVFGSRNSVGQFPESLALIASGAVDVSKLITRRVALADAPKMLADLSDHPEDNLKVLVMF